jgi:hypothetical protein
MDKEIELGMGKCRRWGDGMQWNVEGGGMKINRWLAVLGAILAMGASMNANAGWFGMGGDTMNWKEEVLLHDGQIVVAERFYHLGGYPAIESQERAALDVTVSFNLPGTNIKIVWKNDFRDSEPEPNSLNLIRLDVVKGVPYVATYPAGCIAYNKWGRPNPPQVLFKYEGEQWKRITVAELPTELVNANANVIVGRPAAKLLKSFYTVADVNKENHDIHAAEYKTILQEPVRGAGESCGEMVRTSNGSWIGIGWFRDQPSHEACLKYCAFRKVDAKHCPCESIFERKSQSKGPGSN